ncbi:hypothetical protein BDV19DRAFT_357041 [Aspergillus venezuelensis]
MAVASGASSTRAVSGVVVQTAVVGVNTGIGLVHHIRVVRAGCGVGRAVASSTSGTVCRSASVARASTARGEAAVIAVHTGVGLVHEVGVVRTRGR